MEKYTVDSISDGVVRLLLRRDESDSLFIPAEQLSGVKEGDIISARIQDGKVLEYVVEVQETASAKAKIQEKLDKLRNRPRP